MAQPKRRGSKAGCKNALKKMIGEGTFSTKPFVER